MTSRPSGRSDATGHRKLRDPYANLLRDSRRMLREPLVARDAWFTALSVERREELLFEFEMLLKGVGCWSNPRNHPGPAAPIALHDRDFRVHLRVAQAAMGRALALVEALCGARRRSPGFRRYLDPSGLESTAETVVTNGPEESLAELRQALMSSLEVFGGLSQGPRVPFRLFFAAIAQLRREVARSGYFNPLMALEFRPEFDRIRQTEVLEALQTVEGDTAHRLTALTFLSCFRMLRLAQMAEVFVAGAVDAAGIKRAYVVMAVIRSDARALLSLLRTRSGALLAEAMEQELMLVSAADMRLRFDPLAREIGRLVRLRATLYGCGSLLRAELGRAFRGSVLPCDEPTSEAELASGVLRAMIIVREALQACVLQVLSALGGDTNTVRLFSDPRAKRAQSERTRQGAWMFSLITRAFVAKAKALPERVVDSWEAPSAHAFLLDYARYFRAIGQKVAIETGYPDAERLIHTVESLRDADHVSPAGILSAVGECDAFLSHMASVFDQTSLTEELRASGFDKAAAGASLRMHLEA